MRSYSVRLKFSHIVAYIQAFLQLDDSIVVKYNVLRKDRDGSSRFMVHPGAELRNAHDDAATAQHKPKPTPTITP